MKFYKKIQRHDQSFIIKITYFGGDQIGISAYGLENTAPFKESITLCLGSLPDYDKHYEEIKNAYNTIYDKCVKHAQRHALPSQLINAIIKTHDFSFVPENGIK